MAPGLAEWLVVTLAVEAIAGAVLMTKDRDFVGLLERFGPPPKVLWVTCGNTSNAHLKSVPEKTLRSALKLLEGGERLVEISDPAGG